MDTKTLTETLTRQADKCWEQFCEIRPKMVHFNPPKIILSKRLYRTAGYCSVADNEITLGYKFFIAKPEYYREMFSVILPHELAHQVHYNMLGQIRPARWHDAVWGKIMTDFGLPANTYHSMQISR